MITGTGRQKGRGGAGWLTSPVPFLLSVQAELFFSPGLKEVQYQPLFADRVYDAGQGKTAGQPAFIMIKELMVYIERSKFVNHL